MNTGRKKKSGNSQSMDSFFGILEQIDIHDNPEFAIYDMLGHRIKCSFPSAKLDLVKSLIGKYVDISGLASYKPKDIIPYKVDIQSIEEYIDPVAKINPRDLYGSNSGFDKDKSATEIIRELRDREP